MKAVNITLTFNGQTEEAFNFYKSVFGGEFIHIQRMKDIPGPEPVVGAEGEKILHVALPIGGAVLNGMDIPQGRPQSNRGDNFMITLETESEDETTKIFNGLAEGGFVMMPLAQQFWATYFGMVKDKFGIQWMLSYIK